jgi:hypothetical protein
MRVPLRDKRPAGECAVRPARAHRAGGPRPVVRFNCVGEYADLYQLCIGGTLGLYKRGTHIKLWA